MAAISWKSGINGDWGNAADWSTGTVPGAGDAVTIAATAASVGAYTVDIANESEAAASLVQSQAQSTLALISGTLTLGGTYTLAAGDLVLDNGTLTGGVVSGQGGSILVGNSDNLISDVTLKGSVKLMANQQGGGAFLDGITNAGTLAVTHASIDTEGTLANSGVISLSGTDVFVDVIGSFANTGLVTIGGGAIADLGAVGQSFSNSGTIEVTDGVLEVGGSFTLAQLGSVNLSAGGTIGVFGTLTNTGVLALGPGTSLPTLLLFGDLDGGTLTGAASGLLAQAGTLSGVTVDGVLALTGGNANLHLANGLTTTGASGSGAGSIVLTGIGSALYADDAETLNNVTVSIGADGYGATLETNFNGTLTLGGNAVVQQSGAVATLEGFYSPIINDGRILASQSGGTLQFVGNVSNAGTVAVSNGETLLLTPENSQYADGFVNTGTISVTDGVLALGQASTLADLSTIHLVRSTVEVTGGLQLDGGTLNVGRGSTVPALIIAAEVANGTLHANGGVQFVGEAAELTDLVVEGSLSIARPVTHVVFDEGVTLTGLQGSGPGSLSLTGAGDELVLGETTLDHVNVSVGSHVTSYEGQPLGAAAIVGDDLEQPLQIGAYATIRQTDLYAQIGGTASSNAPVETTVGVTTSSAAIVAGVAQGSLLLEGQSFTNAGRLTISNTETVTAGATSFVNDGSIVIGAGSALDLDLYNYFVSGTVAAQSFTNTGTIQLSGGTLTELTDSGAVPDVALLEAKGGIVKGVGTVQSGIVNDGTVEAVGGELDVAGSVTGTGGKLDVDGSSTLVLAGVSKGETAHFVGVGGVLGLQPAAFLGAIGGFAAGDTIDLLATHATSAAFSGKRLVVTLSTGATLQLATTSALTGSLTVTAGPHGDSLVQFATAANVASPPALPRETATTSDIAWRVSPTADPTPGGTWLHVGHTL